MFCKDCGVLIEDDSIYCRFCGVKIRPDDFAEETASVCEECGKKRIPQARYCIFCGAEDLRQKERKPAKVNICPDCGKEVPADVRFCVNCGGDTQPSASDEAVEIEPWLDIEDAPVLVIPGAQTDKKPEELTPEEILAQTVEDLPVADRHACPHCGKPLESHMVFCIFCGVRVRQDDNPGIGSPSEFFSKLAAEDSNARRCPYCLSEIAEKQRFCVKCGAFIAEDAMRTGEIAPRICRVCSKPLKPGAKFCVFCGTKAP